VFGVWHVPFLGTGQGEQLVSKLMIDERNSQLQSVHHFRSIAMA
jgi:hypothetical protein